MNPAVRRNMQANKGKDTAPELALRALLHRRGLRFRVNAPLPFSKRRRADITFTRVKLYVFIDGCFWHGCPEHYVPPKTRSDYWSEKVRANTDRDRDTDRRLAESGGTVLRFWEHEDSQRICSRVESEYRELVASRAVE